MTTRILRRPRFRRRESIDRSQHIRLFELRRGTTQFVPAPCIDDDQTSIRILENIGWMKIEIVRPQQVLVDRRECSALLLEDMSTDLAEVEGTRK